MYQGFRGLSPAAGYRPVYRAHENNYCPGCGQSHWIVGRATAECVFCATALPLQEAGASGAGVFRRATTTSIAAAA